MFEFASFVIALVEFAPRRTFYQVWGRIKFGAAVQLCALAASVGAP